MHRAFPGDFIVLQHEKFDSLTEIRNNMEIIKRSILISKHITKSFNLHLVHLSYQNSD